MIKERIKNWLIGQDESAQGWAADVKSVQKSTMWKVNESDSDTETEFKPFENLTKEDFKNVYERVDIARFACENMARDILQNGINVKGRNKNILIDKQWQELDTPQNPHWGLRQLLHRWLTLERLYGWAAIGMANGAYFVFSEEEYQDKAENYPKTNTKTSTLRPEKLSCRFEYDNLVWEYTFKADEVVLLVTRPKCDSWKGYSILEPVYPTLVYLTNIMYGNAQAIWRHGVGNFVVYWPQNTNLKEKAIEFGSMGNKKTVHLTPLNLGSDWSFDRVKDVSLSGSIQNIEGIIKLYYSVILAYLEVPETWYFGTGAGALASSYMNAIQYESTIQNCQDDYYNGVLEAINLITKYNISEFEWNSAQRMDDLTKAEMLEGVSFLTINEKRERFDESLPTNKPEWDVIPDLTVREFEISGEPADRSQKPDVEEPLDNKPDMGEEENV